MKIYDIIPTFAYRPEFRHLTGVAAGAVATAVGAAVGAIGASAISSSSARKSTKETNATNLELAQETNKTNTENVKATNATNIQLQREMNDFNLDQWYRNNEYNSMQSQMARWTAAGMNPNAFVSSTSSQPVQQTTLPSLSVPNLVTPQMQSSADIYLQSGLRNSQILSELVGNLSGINKDVADAKKAGADANKAEADAAYTLSQKDVQAALAASNISLNKATEQKLQSDISVASQQIAYFKQQIATQVQQCQLLKAQTSAQEIANVFEPERCKLLVDTLKSQIKLNENEIKVALKRLPFELGLISSQTDANYAAAELSRAQASLTKEEINRVRALYNILTTQNARELFSFYLDLTYGETERQQGISAGSQEIKDLEYKNSFVGRTTGAIRDIGVGIGAALGAAAAVKKAGKSPKGSSTISNGTNSSGSFGNQKSFDFSPLIGD